MAEAVEKKAKMGYTAEQMAKAIHNHHRLAGTGNAPGYSKWGFAELIRNRVWFDNLLDGNWEGFLSRGDDDDNDDDFESQWEGAE
ncbi:hypothetical protein MYX75_07920 [Acidobacteria bacterium AH-259-A15]|nr:hypothetical protein [Acidobacteria bacterium AH-259-A15]